MYSSSLTHQPQVVKYCIGVIPPSLGYEMWLKSAFDFLAPYLPSGHQWFAEGILVGRIPIWCSSEFSDGGSKMLPADLLNPFLKRIVRLSCTRLHIHIHYFQWIFSILTANKVNVLKFQIEGIQSMHFILGTFSRDGQQYNF